MMHRVVVITHTKEDAEAIHKLIADSKLYRSSDHIIQLGEVKEVCDECAKKWMR